MPRRSAVLGAAGRFRGQSSGLAGPVGGPPGVAWTRVFTEEFDQANTTALLAEGRWRSGWFGDGVLTLPVNDFETGFHDRANVTVSGGQLTLAASLNTIPKTVSGQSTKPNLTSMINTDTNQGASTGFRMTYGYAEARIRMPAATGQGIWPAWWLTGDSWPSCMEIDIVEAYGSDSENYFNVHYGPGSTQTTTLDGVGNGRTVVGATSGFHTYACDIRTNGITFYYDGVSVYDFVFSIPNVTRYLVLNNACDGTLTGTRTMLVDYVRTWVRS